MTGNTNGSDPRAHTSAGSLTAKDLRRAFEHGVVAPHEERLLRMRHGITEGKQSALSFRGQDNEALRIKLAMIEATALEQLEGGPPSPAPTKKEKIIERLSRM